MEVTQVVGPSTCNRKLVMIYVWILNYLIDRLYIKIKFEIMIYCFFLSFLTILIKFSIYHSLNGLI